MHNISYLCIGESWQRMLSESQSSKTPQQYHTVIELTSLDIVTITVQNGSVDCKYVIGNGILFLMLLEL
jgi:hypothetical protein